MSDESDSVRTYLDGVTPEKRRRDAGKLLELMARVTGDAAAAGFAPRKAATTIYLVDGIGRYGAQLERLGPHTTGVGCLYIKDLEKIDLSVLENIVAESYRTLTDGTYMLRAREGTPAPPAE